jgi:MFS transporter, DHA2 family, multidrug resistance protein
MALLPVLGPLLLPEYRDPEPRRFDLPSAALSLAAVLAAIYGLKQIVQEGPGWLPALTIVAGLAFALVFVQRQRSIADPLIDLGLAGLVVAAAGYGLFSQVGGAPESASSSRRRWSSGSARRRSSR